MKVLLAGCGIWGRNILERLLRLGCEVHVVEPGEEARASALSLGAASVSAALPVRHDSPAAVVASPAATHAMIVQSLLAALPREAAVLCEKPLAVSSTDALSMAAAAPGRLFVGHVWRYHAGIVRLGELARSGELGRVSGVRSVRVNWTSPRRDVDSVWNLVPHDITLGIEILSHIPEPRWATVERIDGRPCGMFGVLGDSPWVVFESSNRYADKRREVRVHGGAAVAVLPAVDAPFIEIVRSGAGGAPVIEQLPLPGTDALTEELAAFLAFAKGSGPPPKSDAQEGVAVVRTVEHLRKLAGLDSELAS